MRIKTKLKSKKLNKKLFSDIRNIGCTLKAGYPQENSSSHEVDQNGFSALQKANAINFSDSNFKPYMQISFTKGKIKYQKKFILIAKLKPNKQKAQLEILGNEMVTDIKSTLSQLKVSPLLTTKGSIFGSISFVKVK